MLLKIKTYAIAIGSILFTILTLGAYVRNQKRKADKANEYSQKLKRLQEKQDEIIKNYKERNKQETIVSQLDDDTINQQLHNNGNLRD